MEKFTLRRVEYTKEDVEQAIRDLDEQKYKNKKWTTKEQGYTYYIRSGRGYLYGLKRIFECLAKNKGKDVPGSNFSPGEVKDKLERLGFEIITGPEKSNTDIVTNECNLILYGPPGTGKTYNTEIEAVKIIGLEKCFKDWFRKTSKAKNIEKTLSDYLSHINKINTDYLVNDNIFSYILLDEYELLQERILSSDYIKNDKTKLNPNSYYQHALKRYYEFLKQFTYNDIQTEFKRLKKEKQIEFITFHQSYSYEEFVEGIKPDVQNKKISYKLENGLFKNICNIANANKDKKFVLVIDEINRGNISKIFGELITLIEDDKRENLSVTLPYSKDNFTVPKNLHIIGTMNTSDRSIASVDIALRRRFKFKEMMPDVNLVANFNCKFEKCFKILNKRIAILLDRDHQIGHSYFIQEKYKNAGINDLKKIWFDSIIPLLNEYFYGDWEKLQAILGEAKDNDNSFIKLEKIDDKLFMKKTDICETEVYDFNYECNFKEAMKNAFGDNFEEETNADS